VQVVVVEGEEKVLVPVLLMVEESEVGWYYFA
jgi:hypothetical protein